MKGTIDVIHPRSLQRFVDGLVALPAEIQERGLVVFASSALQGRAGTCDSARSAGPTLTMGPPSCCLPVSTARCSVEDDGARAVHQDP